MANPTLLQQARQHLIARAAAIPKHTDSQLACALECLLQYLEARHAAASGLAPVPAKQPAPSAREGLDSLDLDALQQLCNAPDLAFIAAARDALPKLIAMVRQLQADARVLAAPSEHGRFAWDQAAERVLGREAEHAR